MKISITPREIKFTLCTVSSSILLCSSMEAQAGAVADETVSWYQENAPVLNLPVTVITPGPQRSEARPERFMNEEIAPGAWDRFYGQGARQAQTDILSSGFAAPGSGPLKGPAVLTLKSASGYTQTLGLIGGENQIHANANGPISHRALADPSTDALSLQGQSVGAYYSLTGLQGWHVDLSASGGRVNGFSRNSQGARQAAEGSAITFSVEGGYPIGLSENWVVEPQAQLINQRVSLNTPNASGGTGSSSDMSAWSGRVGARLKGSYDLNGLPVEPYVRTNLWHTVYTGNTVTLDQVDKISSSRKSSTVELGLGLVARVTPAVSLYMSADYSSDVDDNDLNGLIGSLGVRMRW
ncbi:autotransporter outer membrane beta-barrel domain-containing protein [Pseudomonas sp. SWRI153]|uniref:Autotransporter outer membrane beta-barrel domain-containing protein n=1 Tax=Pseudomonas khorasanensis TaxID=2745508 RepID=A0A923EZX8_9PSED|nr:autotransporter outer membrane beta-barrel domain-containing protein [Pseudomonas khorasanensis]MBV4484840.1 autotransporter outer membrane beta-barrel domain-containing protein [Pseudomonas khorasanensis]